MGQPDCRELQTTEPEHDMASRNWRVCQHRRLMLGSGRMGAEQSVRWWPPGEGKPSNEFDEVQPLSGPEVVVGRYRKMLPRV